MSRRGVWLLASTCLLVGASLGIAGNYLWGWARNGATGAAASSDAPVLPSKVLANFRPKALVERYMPEGTSVAQTGLEGEDSSDVHGYNKRASVSWVGDTDFERTVDRLKADVEAAITGKGGVIQIFLDEPGNFSRGYQVGNIRGMIRVFSFYHKGHFAVVITAVENRDR